MQALFEQAFLKAVKRHASTKKLRQLLLDEL